MRFLEAVLVVALLLPLLAGCASTQRTDAQPADPRATPVFRGNAAPASWQDMVAEAAAADVVMIGENHGHPVGLASAAALFDDILAQKPGAALALEFFERDQQPRIDDYLAGLGDEKAFRTATSRTDGNYPDGHRRMLEAAKSKGAPVIASNAPRVYVRTARTDGYEKLSKLTPEQKRLFRIPDELPTGKYRTDFDELMGGGASHAAPGKEAKEESPEEKQKKLDASFRSQSMWDWTMAESIARALDAGRTPVVQVVGRFHSDFRGGLVQALEKLRPGTRIVTVTFVPQTSASLQDDDKGRADFVLYAGPAPEEK